MSGVSWPEPKFVPMGKSGAQLNPDRVNMLYDAIKQELVLGEIVRLFERLGIPELMDEEREKARLSTPLSPTEAVPDEGVQTGEKWEWQNKYGTWNPVTDATMISTCRKLNLPLRARAEQRVQEDIGEIVKAQAMAALRYAFGETLASELAAEIAEGTVLILDTRSKQAPTVVGPDEDALPSGHIVLEQSEDLKGMVHQTVRVNASGEEYQRIVHSDEAYGCRHDEA